MNKIIIFSALTALLLTGCSETAAASENNDRVYAETAAAYADRSEAAYSIFKDGIDRYVSENIRDNTGTAELTEDYDLTLTFENTLGDTEKYMLTSYISRLEFCVQINEVTLTLICGGEQSEYVITPPAVSDSDSEYALFTPSP